MSSFYNAMFYMIFTDMNRSKYAISACFHSFLNGNINIFVVTLRQQLNSVKCIVQQLRISAMISALHDIISYMQTGQIQC